MLEKRAKRIFLFAAAGLAAISLIFSAPFLLSAASPKGTDWARLSEISQAYGALSVILSAGALVGVAISLAYQSRQTRIAQEETTWSAHRELLLRAIDNPDFLTCWDPPEASVTADMWKRVVYTNLIFQDWQKTFLFGLMSEAQLRRTFTLHFRGQIAREHWRHAGGHYREDARLGPEQRGKLFVQIVDECYVSAEASGPPVAADDYFI